MEMSKISDQEFCQNLLHLIPGYVLSKLERQRMCRIIKGHPHKKEKVGAGIHHISVQISCRPPARCFVLHRIDGSVIDISYRKCMGLETNGKCDIKNMVLV